MKLLVLFLSLLLPAVSQAQERPLHSRFQSIKPTPKPASSPLLARNKPLEQVSIGDTLYVITNTIFYSRPVKSTANKSPVYLYRTQKITVEEVTDDQWLFVDHYNGDVGVSGYAIREYLSHKKPD
ncbi:MAG: hypothetical protein ACRYFK_08355 [Janthinobacterium lividum]